MNAAVMQLRGRAQGVWKGLAPRERRGLAIAVTVLAAFAVWSLFVQPAWRTLQAAPAQLDRLESELQRMQRLAAEAQELRGAAPVPPDQAAAALQAAASRLGNGTKTALIGERATVTFTGASPDALRAWLGEVRSAARARPVEAQLSQVGGGYSGSVTVVLEAAP